MEWIKCSDRMPEYEQKILGLTSEFKYYGLMLILVNNEKYWLQIGNGFSFSLDTIEVTHWMPLPKPPKETP